MGMVPRATGQTATVASEEIKATLAIAAFLLLAQSSGKRRFTYEHLSDRRVPSALWQQDTFQSLIARVGDWLGRVCRRHPVVGRARLAQKAMKHAIALILLFLCGCAGNVDRSLKLRGPQLEYEQHRNSSGVVITNVTNTNVRIR